VVTGVSTYHRPGRSSEIVGGRSGSGGGPVRRLRRTVRVVAALSSAECTVSSTTDPGLPRSQEGAEI
jgi:hypothetical protein